MENSDIIQLPESTEQKWIIPIINMKNKQVFESREALISHIATNMPDEYPAGYAHFLADKMIEEKSVILNNSKNLNKHNDYVGSLP